jgi:hypothetical protein
VLALEPSTSARSLHLLRIELWAGPVRGGRHADRACRGDRWPLVRPELAALRAFARATTAASVPPSRRWRRRRRTRWCASRAMRVALFTGDLDGAARIARLLVAVARAPESGPWGGCAARRPRARPRAAARRARGARQRRARRARA